MLRKLKIKNLAVIDSAELELEDGFCVLTGETGAGKSLVVGAIELLLGGKADSGRVRTGEKEAVIDGLFEIDGRKYPVRRKIMSSGRSYAWISEDSVGSGKLRDITSSFADLLGQHEHQVLLDPETHIRFLDNFAGNSDRIKKYSADFEVRESLQKKLKHLDRIIADTEEKGRLRDFELSELAAASLDVTEYEEISATLRRIESSEEIIENANAAFDALSEGDSNAISLLVSAQRALNNIAEFIPECKQISELLETAQAAADEAAREVESIAQSVEIDPEEAEQLRHRQLSIQRLCRKYNRDVAGLVEYSKQLEREADDIDRLQDERRELEKEIRLLSDKLASGAEELSICREKTAPKLVTAMITALSPLGMDNVQFEVKFKRISSETGPLHPDGEQYELLPTGFETAEFYISTNPGEKLRPLAAIVSGGELSRIMLALKALFVDEDNTGLLVFDEVDTGIGGDVGKAVGRALVELATKKQLLVITHLPQIARMADYHYNISKYEQDGRTRVRLARVTGAKRDAELARMHGEEIEIESFV